MGAPARRRAEQRASRGTAREQAARRLAVLHRAPEWERAARSERERAGLRPPARPGAQVRAEARARSCAVEAGADEGAGSWATGAGAGGAGGTGAGVTGARSDETGSMRFVWLLAVQKTAATATRTTPPSKAHNQRDMASPSRRSELSPMMGDPHPSVESVGERSRGATFAVVNLSWRAHDAASHVT